MANAAVVKVSSSRARVLEWERISLSGKVVAKEAPKVIISDKVAISKDIEGRRGGSALFFGVHFFHLH